jgi:hypothetical protein
MSDLRTARTDRRRIHAAPFADFYCRPVPEHHAFNRAFNWLTLEAVNELVVQAAPTCLEEL